MIGDDLKRLVHGIAATLDGTSGREEHVIDMALRALEEAGIAIEEAARQELGGLRFRRLEESPSEGPSPPPPRARTGLLGFEPGQLVYRIQELGSLVMGMLSSDPLEPECPRRHALYRLVGGGLVVSSLDVAALVVFVVALGGLFHPGPPRTATGQAQRTARAIAAPALPRERYIVFAVPAPLAEGLLQALEASDHQANEEIVGLLAERCRWIGLQQALPEFQTVATPQEPSVHDLLVLMTDDRMTIPRGFEKDASGLARRDAFKDLGRNGVKLRVLSERLPQEELAREGFFALA